jgi:hypothetical protein
LVGGDRNGRGAAAHSDGRADVIRHSDATTLARGAAAHGNAGSGGGHRAAAHLHAAADRYLDAVTHPD